MKTIINYVYGGSLRHLRTSAAPNLLQSLPYRLPPVTSPNFDCTHQICCNHSRIASPNISTERSKFAAIKISTARTKFAAITPVSPPPIFRLHAPNLLQSLPYHLPRIFRLHAPNLLQSLPYRLPPIFRLNCTHQICCNHSRIASPPYHLPQYFDCTHQICCNYSRIASPNISAARTKFAAITPVSPPPIFRLHAPNLLQSLPYRLPQFFDCTHQICCNHSRIASSQYFGWIHALW